MPNLSLKNGIRNCACYRIRTADKSQTNENAILYSFSLFSKITFPYKWYGRVLLVGRAIMCCGCSFFLYAMHFHCERKLFYLIRSMSMQVIKFMLEISAFAAYRLIFIPNLYAYDRRILLMFHDCNSSICFCLRFL